MKLILIIFGLMLLPYVLFQIGRKKNTGNTLFGSYFWDILMIFTADLIVCVVLAAEFPQTERLAETIPVQDTSKSNVPEHGGTYTYLDTEYKIRSIRSDLFVTGKAKGEPVLNCYLPEYESPVAEELCGDILDFLMHGRYRKIEILL